MEREDLQTPQPIELGIASRDTQGNEGVVPEGGLFWPRTGISED